MDEIKFRHVENVQDVAWTLYPETEFEVYKEKYIVGWCPEARKTFVVNAKNVVEDEA